jgi:ABC-2 type transport system ATP-binding protein
MENGQNALFMQDACLDFGGGAGVFDLTFSLPKGAILGLIGPSGCGKTTTIRLLNGIYEPTAGEVRVFDKPPVSFTKSEKEQLGYIPQQFILYPNLSAEENLHFLGGIYGMSRGQRKAKIAQLLAFVELTDARKRLGRQLSGGMQRRLMLAGALLHDPELLFADEPTAGIDPILRARIWDNFRNLRDQGKTLLVTTQYVGEAAYCDQVAVMRNGRLVTVDTPQGLRRQAMDGEVLHFQVGRDRIAEVRRFLDGLPQVKRTELAPDDPDGLHVFVEDAGHELPILLAILREQKDITPMVAEPYLPPFDEVFVRLIQRSEAAQP